MSQIRHIKINNFRSLKEFEWFPNPGLNCLIGPGDSGKSTILDAIDIALGARRSYPFTDADFYQLDVTNPIVIYITIGALDDSLKNLEIYGKFLRGFDSSTHEITDEPQVGLEVVLTIKLFVSSDLDPDWQLFSDRSEQEGYERRLSWKHRGLITPARLGATSNHHLAWGNRSLLNKLSEEDIDLTATLTELSRNARDSFAGQEIEVISDVLSQVKELANNLGVNVGDLKALLDVNSFSLSHGAISLHNDDNTPLRQLGTGSSRLLISAIQKAASTSNILIVDEAEYGLEPFRISRLLNELGSKDNGSTQQVFITTHSPYVLRELQAHQLHVVRKAGLAPFPPPFINYSHRVFSMSGGDSEQSTLRVCAEAFFSKAVIVCEGKTEIGLVRGIDLYRQDMNDDTIYSHGTYCADGGGESMFQRAKVFRSLGYPTALFKDSDKQDEHNELTLQVKNLGVTVFEWGHDFATEDVLFMACPNNLIKPLLELAIERKGRDSVNSNIQTRSDSQFTLDNCLQNFGDDMRPALGKAAKHKRGSWYKDIEPAEYLARQIISPNYQNFAREFTDPVSLLFEWALPEVK